MNIYLRVVAVFSLLIASFCWASLPAQAQSSAVGEISNTPQTEAIEPSNITPKKSDVVEVNPEEARLPTQFELAETADLNDDVRAILLKHVRVLNQKNEPKTNADMRLIRFSLRREIAGLVATEGYFSPTVDLKITTTHQQRQAVINVNLGAITKINQLQINLVGDTVTPELKQAIIDHWGLPVGAPFREDDWSNAKKNALQMLTEQRYPAAKIATSQATIDAEQAALRVELDSGTTFYFGKLAINGLVRYQPWLLARYNPPKEGEIYSRARLLKFQRDLQNSPYFGSVNVSIDPTSEQADAVPIDVLVTERKRFDFGMGAGYSSNTGARGEVSFRDRNYYDAAYDLRSVIRIEQKRQIAYTDVYLPPRSNGYLDSFGVLINRADISGLVTSTASFGAKRLIIDGNVERRLGLSYVYEESTVAGGNQTLAKALVGNIGRTWRNVDNVLDPHKGSILQVDVSAAPKAFLSDQNFVRLYSKYQQWFELGAKDVIIMRLEGGYVIANHNTGIPEEVLFRTGGTGSLRGYAYQSIGVNKNNGVVGGRVLATASAEYVHWVKPNWGAATFVDTGDAADTYSTLRLKQSMGVGGRYKTPAGPIALDLAYAHDTKSVRLDFSIGIAF